jgi:peptidoglycan/xylan/chitin deacetylase (PgdA/CDA1 family)
VPRFFFPTKIGRFIVAMLLGATSLLGAPRVAGADCASQFDDDLRPLRSAVGEVMGQPLDCENPTAAGGEMVQATSTGTAWYRRSDNVATFTDGYHRWELSPDGLTYWASPDAVPLLLDGLPDGPATWTRPVTCPVLYTHEVPPIATFRRFVTGLMQAGYQPTSFAVVDAALSGQGELPRGCVVLSFDDTLASQLRNAVPVLAELKLTAMFFVMPAYRDGRHEYLGEAGIRDIHNAGQIIGAHTCNHPSLTLLSPAPMMAELSDCKQQIENIIGTPVRYFAYPNGAVNQTVLAATAQAGYRAAFTTRPSTTLRPDQPLLLPRIRYDATEAPSTVIQRLRS